MKLVLTAAYTALLAATAAAGEAEVTLQSTVSGNREQPRVVYIVPWQEPAAAALGLDLHGGIAEELFAPVDRDEFRRELAYRETAASAGQPRATESARSTTAMTTESTTTEE